MPQDKIDLLYKDLQGEYDLGSIDDFKSYLSDNKKRELFFNEIVKPRYDVTDIGVFEDTYGLKKKEPAIGLGYEKPSEALRMGGLPKQEKLSQSPLKTAATITPSVSTKKQWTQQDQKSLIEKIKTGDLTGQTPEEDDYLSRIGSRIVRGMNTLNYNLSKTPEFVYNLAAYPQNVIAEKFDIPALAVSADKVKKELGIQNEVADYYKDQINQLASLDDKYMGANGSVTNLAKEGKYLDAAKLLGEQIAESLPTTAAIAASGGLGASSTAITLGGGAVFGAAKYDELADRTDLTESQKTSISFATGLTEGLFENLGTGNIGRIVKDVITKQGAAKGKEVAKGMFITAYKDALKKYMPVSGALQGGIEEAATTFAQNAIDIYTGVDPQKKLSDGLIDAFAVGTGSDFIISSPVLLSKDRNKKVAEKQVEVDEIDSEINNPNLSDDAKATLSQKRGKIMSDINDVIDEDVNEQRALPDATKREIEQIQDGLEQIGIDIENTKSEFAKKELESKRVELENRIDELTKTGATTTDGKGRTKEAVSAGTDVLETGVGMAAEPGKEGIAGEDIQAETVSQVPLTEQTEKFGEVGKLKGYDELQRDENFEETDLNEGQKQILKEKGVAPLKQSEIPPIVYRGITKSEKIKTPEDAIKSVSEFEDFVKENAPKTGESYGEAGKPFANIFNNWFGITLFTGQSEEVYGYGGGTKVYRFNQQNAVAKKVDKLLKEALVNVSMSDYKGVNPENVISSIKENANKTIKQYESNIEGAKNRLLEIESEKGTKSPEDYKYNKESTLEYIKMRERQLDAAKTLLVTTQSLKPSDIDFLIYRGEKDSMRPEGGFGLELKVKDKPVVISKSDAYKLAKENNTTLDKLIENTELFKKLGIDGVMYVSDINAIAWINPKDVLTVSKVLDFLGDKALVSIEEATVYINESVKNKSITNEQAKQYIDKSSDQQIEKDSATIEALENKARNAKTESEKNSIVQEIENLLGTQVSEKVTEVTAPAIEVTPTAEPTKPAAKAEPTKKASKTEAKKSKPEQIGEGLLYALGLELVEPAKKAGKKKPVNVSNKSELSELEGKAQGDKKTIIEAAKKAIATLKSVFPDMEIYIHEDTDSYNETMSEVGGVANSRGNFAFERDANNNPTGRGRIDINLSNAKDTTVAHELVHAVLLKAFGDNPGLFKAFRDRMSRILRTDLNEQVTAFEKLYAGQDVAPEEYLTELAALLSQGGETVEYKPSTLRKVAALINEFVSRITKGKFQPFKSEVDFINFVGFLNQISGAISEGGEIDAITEKINTSAKPTGIKVDTSSLKSKASLIQDLGLERFNDMGKRITQGVTIKDLGDVESHLTFSDRLVTGKVGKKDFLGGILFAAATNRVWASFTKTRVSQIISGMPKNKDGYRYLMPALLTEAAHMSNKDMSNTAIKLVEDAIAKGEISPLEADARIRKALGRKGLEKFLELYSDTIGKNKITPEIIISAIDKGLVKSSTTFEDRNTFLETLLGKADIDLKKRFGTLPSYGVLANGLAEPITNGHDFGDILLVIRTKGDLIAVQPKEGDADYHPSYPWVIRSVNPDGSIAEVETLIFKESYNAVDVFPEVTNKQGQKFTYQQYVDKYGSGAKSRYLGYMGARSAMSTSVTEKIVSEAQPKATIVSKSQRVDKASEKLKELFQRDNIPLTIAEAKVIVEEVYDWTSWYDGLAAYVSEIFGEYSEDILSMLPLASMAANSSATVGLAINNAEKIYRGEKPSGVAEYYGYVTDFLEGKGIKSDKMSEFFKALTGNKDAIAVDMHVYSIIMGKNPNKKQVNPKNKQEFDNAKEFVRTLATELDLAPREVQAALWAANILRTGGRPDSYEQYFKKQIDEKGLKERIENWRNEGYKPFSEIRKDAEASAQKEGATITSKSQVDVYHGSPYDFDKFTTEKIGTGEGAQAFGWGLYFTDLKSIAENYANKLSTELFSYDGKPISQVVYDYLFLADDAVSDIKFDGKRIKELAPIAIDKINNEYIPDFKDIQKTSFSEKQRREMPAKIKEAKNAIKELQDIINSKEITSTTNKKVYEVSLHEGKTPDQYTWLEWDKPVSDLNRNKIKSQFEKEGIPKEINSPSNETMRLLGKQTDFKDYRPNPITGSTKDFYENLVRYFYGMNIKNPQKEASLFLLRAGIDGIKYPAESISRGATSDTARGFNYVVFDENAVTIKSKAQKAQDASIKEFIDAQRKAGQSDKDIKAGLELVADKVGLTPEDINNLMGVESDEAKPKKGYTPKKKRLEPAQEPEAEKTGTRAFAAKSVERAGVPIEDIPASLKNYRPTTVEEQQKIAEAFIRKHGIDNTIIELRLPDSGIDPKSKPVLASVLLKELYAEQGNTKDVAEIEKIAIDVHNVLDAVLTAATEAAQFMAMMREFYNSNPYNYVAQVTRLIEKNINNPIKANVATAVVDINKANKDAAAKAASNVVNEVVTSKVTSAKEKFERSKANLKALWKKSFNIGIASNQYEAAKNDVQFAKALTIMAKDFVVYQSVQFGEFLKEVASQIGLNESDIDKDHLRKIFEKAKSERIQAGIKVGLKELELKLKDLIESHYSSTELEGKLIDKLKSEFGVGSEFGLNDAAIKELENAIKREIKVLTAKEKIKALKALGIKEQKDVNEILSLSEEGLLDDNAILETLGDKLGIKKLTPEEAAKLADLAKDINESKEDRIKARNIQKFEDYKFVLAKKYKIQDFLISNYLTNIFGSLTSNEKNIAGNVSETILLVGELMGNALASGNPKDIQRALKALVDGNIRGFDFTKEVLTTGVASYKEPGDIRARNMWELIMDRENDLTRVERNLQKLFTIPYLGPVLLAERRFWNRALLSMDSLSGTTNNELGSLLAATREADKQKLRGAKRTKFIEEQMANSAEAQEEARNYAISAGYKEGTGEFNRAVANYLVSKRPEAIKKAAAEYSARATLTQNPPPSTMTGAIANGLNDVISKNPNIKFFVPVVNTFANLIVKNIERSPFEFFSLAFDAGRAASGVESAKAGLTKAEVARRMKTAAVWTAISVLLFALAGGTDDEEEGFEVFGSGTGDPAVDKARRALGWKPNTIRFSKDGGYYNFEFLPFGFVLGMIGNMRDYFKYKNKPAFAIRQAQAKKIFGKNLDALDKNEREQLEAELAIPGKYNISAQEKKEFANLSSELALTPVTYSFQLLKSLGELVNAVGEGAGAINTAMKSITNISRGLAAPRYLGEVRDIFDNKLYDSKEFRNVIGANVPFVKLGNVKLDAFGREIEKYKSESILSGIKYALTRGFYNPPTITELDQFLWENGVGVSVPSNTPSMAYTEDVYREYIVTRGKILITNLTEALKNKEFEGLSPQDVLEVVNIYATNANAEARYITDEKLDKLK